MDKTELSKLNAGAVSSTEESEDDEETEKKKSNSR